MKKILRICNNFSNLRHNKEVTVKIFFWKGLMILSPGSKTRIIFTYLSIAITMVVLGQYIYCKKYSGYKVYMNGKAISYIKNKEDVYKAKENIESSLKKRLGNIILKDDIKVEKVVINPKYLSDSNSLKKDIIKSSKANLSAFLMKSDGNNIGFLANEDEMRKVLDNIKNSYKEKDKDGVFKLKNHITYIKEEINIGQLNTVEEAINVATVSKTPLICFYKEESLKEIHNVSLSRSASVSNIMYIPSKGAITSNFGERWGKMHNGIDIGASMGTPIHAAMDGKIYCTEWEEGYGNVIKIDHGSNIETVYAHCSKIDVSVGQYVKCGDKIGEVGSTGKSTGPHVHFEIRNNGIPQDPIKYLK